MGRIAIVSGPSCVGKSPLWHAVRRLHPALTEGLRPVVLYNSRAPRPGEEDGVDYHFRTREEIEAKRNEDGVTVLEVRGDLQAVDFRELREAMSAGDVLYEGNPFVGRELLAWARREACDAPNLFVSPLGADELRELAEPERHVDVPGLVADVMRRKLLRRTQKQKGIPSLPDLREVERRCASAFDELRMAHHFDRVIVNHDGEDSDHWDRHYPLGDARRAVRALAALLDGRRVEGAEAWREGDPV